MALISENMEAENAGTTNMMRTLGRKAGLLTFAGDCIKCILAVVTVRLLFGKSHGDILPPAEFLRGGRRDSGGTISPFTCISEEEKELRPRRGWCFLFNPIMSVLGIITFFSHFFPDPLCVAGLAAGVCGDPY